MVERLPEIDVLLPVASGRAASVTWNGEPVEVDEVKVSEDGTVQIVIAGVTYDEYNAVITSHQESI